MPDIIANFFLFFSNPPAISIIIIGGFLLINRPIFFQLACLSALEIILNVALKGTFQIPESAKLTTMCYAFPSGHMQLTTVFYLWMAMHIFSWPLRIVVAILLAGIGASLIHYDFHDIYDVLGGLLCGILLVVAYQFILTKFAAIVHWLLFATSSLLMIYIGWIYTNIPSYAWTSYKALLGLIVLLLITNKLSLDFNCKETRTQNIDTKPSQD